MSTILGSCTSNNISVNIDYNTTNDANNSDDTVDLSYLNSFCGLNVTSGFEANFNGLNWHALCFTLAFSIAMTEAILSDRAPLSHALSLHAAIVARVCHIIVIAFAITGTVAIVENLSQADYVMYSFHSWCGAAALLLLGLRGGAALLLAALAACSSRWPRTTRSP